VALNSLAVQERKKGRLSGCTVQSLASSALGEPSLSRPQTHVLGQELAVALLRQRLQQPGRWADLAPYWRSLPPGATLYCKELALPHHAAELQDAALARPPPALSARGCPLSWPAEAPGCSCVCS
jgi:hypothetical protein